MAEQKFRTDLFAGVFLLVSLVLLGISIWILGSDRQIFAKQELYKITFQDVQGLNEGAPVRLGGITIGRVSKIGFSPDLTDSRVHVTLLVNDEFLDRVREDSEAAIATQGLLGDKFISISAGGKPKMLLPGSTIKSRETGDFGAVLSKAEEVVENTVQISDNVRKLSDKIQNQSLDDITDAFKNISALTTEMAHGDGLLHKLIYSKKDGETILESLTGASQSIRDITTQVKNGAGLLHTLVYGQGGDETVNAFRKSLEHIGAASEELALVLNKARTGNGTLHSLLYSESSSDTDDLIKNMRMTAENLRQASDALAHGTGTLGALLVDSKLYDNLVDVTGEAKRSVILRGIIRNSIEQQQKERASMKTADTEVKP